jgi:hypothetical protein
LSDFLRTKAEDGNATVNYSVTTWEPSISLWTAIANGVLFCAGVTDYREEMFAVRRASNNYKLIAFT